MKEDIKPFRQKVEDGEVKYDDRDLDIEIDGVDPMEFGKGIMDNVSQVFFESYRSDDENHWDGLVKWYLESEEIRPVIDQVFVDLCGFSLFTLMEKSKEEDRPLI